MGSANHFNLNTLHDCHVLLLLQEEGPPRDQASDQDQQRLLHFDNMLGNQARISLASPNATSDVYFIH